MAENSVCMIFERMKGVINARTDKELREELGAYQSTFSNWKNRNSLPLDVATDFAQKHSVDLNWLLLGEDKQQLDTAQQMALLAFNALNDQQKLQAIAFMSGLQNGTTSGVNMTANGNGNNQQVFSGSVDEVVGIKK